jgi:regulator of protease activity HflC (stomatin/prohibitin superfamily)
MSDFKIPTAFGSAHSSGGGEPPRPGRPGPGGHSNFARNLVAVVLAAIVIYVAYFWCVRRVVVGPDEVLVVMKKNGSKSLPGDQIIIPRPPDQAKDPQGYAKWDETYGDCNGILEQVYLPGTYFSFSPFDYERYTFNLKKGDDSHAIVPSNKVGVVVRKFGAKLDPGQVVADESRAQRGPLAKVLWPGTYYDFANPFAYEITLVDPIQIDPGHRGVVTLMTGKAPKNPNDFLVESGEVGVQKTTEPEGFVYVNPYQRRIKPISVQSQRFEMTGADEIHFPSNDSFDIKLDGFVEWKIDADKVPLIYVQYAEGGSLVEYLEEKVILPYARSFCRIVGSQYSARDFISGDTKLKFQQQFENQLRDACAKQGIRVMQALVRDIVPPDEIKNLINDREIAKLQIKTIEQQMIVAKTQAQLAAQTEMATQNQDIGKANTEVVTVVKKAIRDQDVAITRANQELAVAKLKLEAAQKEADAEIARGQAEANVILLQRQAEAEPLRAQVQAFGDGTAYAQYFFYQKIAPSIKSILTTTDGPFADIFRQFTREPAGSPAPKTEHAKSSADHKVTEVSHD